MAAIFMNATLAINGSSVEINATALEAINAAIKTCPVVTEKWVNDERVFVPDLTQHLEISATYSLTSKKVKNS